MTDKNYGKCIRCGEPIPRALPKDAEMFCDACFMAQENGFDSSLDDEPDYYEEPEHGYEEKKPIIGSFLGLLLSPFMAVGAVLGVIGVFLLGFGFVIVGCMAMPSNSVLGGILFIFGIGIWLVMIFKGINAMFGER